MIVVAQDPDEVALRAALVRFLKGTSAPLYLRAAAAAWLKH